MIEQEKSRWIWKQRYFQIESQDLQFSETTTGIRKYGKYVVDHEQRLSKDLIPSEIIVMVAIETRKVQLVENENNEMSEIPNKAMRGKCPS